MNKFRSKQKSKPPSICMQTKLRSSSHHPFFLHHNKPNSKNHPPPQQNFPASPKFHSPNYLSTKINSPLPTITQPSKTPFQMPPPHSPPRKRKTRKKKQDPTGREKQAYFIMQKLSRKLGSFWTNTERRYCSDVKKAAVGDRRSDRERERERKEGAAR